MNKPAAQIMVGTVVGLTQTERLQLEQLSDLMRVLSRTQKVGWLADWARAHAQAGRILKDAIERSHASGGLGRG